jgi:uncharacterized surface protein with fasciclin (FAS1) repeats
MKTGFSFGKSHDALTVRPAFLANANIQELKMRNRVTVFAATAAAIVAVVVAVVLGSTFARASKQDIVDTAVAAGQFKTLAKALDAAGLVATLKGSGPFTVFAPTDAAFAKLPAGTLQNLLKPENKAKLTAILTYHVVPGAVTAEQVTKLSEAKTVNGAVLKVSLRDGKVMINDADVVKPDIETSNGVIHVIDAVLLPPTD